MNVTGPIRYIVTNDADCVALIGTRIYAGIIPQNTAYPAALITIVGNLPNPTKSGTSDVDNVQVQIDAYGYDYDVVAQIDEAVRNAIDGYRGDIVLGADTVAVDGVRYEQTRQTFDSTDDLWRFSSDYVFRMLRDGSADGGGGTDNTVDGIFTYVAGETMSSGRAVIIDGGEAFYFQPSDTTHAGRLFGITTSGATIGGNITIQVMGEITDAAYTFSPDLPVYVRADGELFNTPGASGLVQIVGASTGTDKLLISIGLTIVR
mgnify:FL=1